MTKPETCTCYYYGIKNEGDHREMVEHSAYQKAVDALKALVNGQAKRCNVCDSESVALEALKELGELE